jgi:hypothetical protein
MKQFKVLSTAALALAVMFSFGCERETTISDTATTDTVVATGAEQPGTGLPGDISPIRAQMWIDDFTIGSELAPEGNIVAGRTGDDFAPGQTVYYAMETGDAPAGAAVRVVWYGPGERKINEETKTVTPRGYLNFRADTSGWEKGDYRVEAWVGDERVNTQQFNITDAARATS